MTLDLVVVGAGPAGSTLAREMALQGARVLLLDRARFPRDKPCGGAVTPRAARLLSVDLTSVIERTVSRAHVRLPRGAGFVRSYPQPLAYTTQRCRLDSLLVERAVEAGAEFRDGVRVRAVEIGTGSVRVRTDSGILKAHAVAGADGAYGVVGLALGLTAFEEGGVALEGRLPCSNGVLDRWQDLVALELGSLPGGYGWVFPKGDHLNLGVGAWRYAAPTLRGHLSLLCRRFGFSEGRLCDLRGHLVPMRPPGAPIVRGPALLLGDAAGLVDPLSGEGISSALLSARLAAGALRAYLSGQARDLSSYERAVDREIMPEIVTSRRLQETLHFVPAPYVAALRFSDYLWRSLCRIMRGETSYTQLRQQLGIARPLLDGWSEIARRRNARRRPEER